MERPNPSIKVDLNRSGPPKIISMALTKSQLINNLIIRVMAHNIHRSHQPSKRDYIGHAHHKEGMNLSGHLIRLPNSTQS